MQNDHDRIDTATKLVNAAMNEIIDLSIDRQTQLLALAELSYRIQGAVQWMSENTSRDPAVEPAPSNQMAKEFTAIARLCSTNGAHIGAPQ